MDKMMDFILCAGITGLEVIAVIAGGMLIQLVVYQLSGRRINLIKEITRLMFKADRYITAKFN